MGNPWLLCRTEGYCKMMLLRVQAKEYLPFAAAQDMAYHTSATAVSNWTTYYGSADHDYAYAEKTFDNSPLNRVMEQSAPGNSWKTGSAHTVKYDYGTDTASENAVMNYTIDNTTRLVNLTATAYPANSLYKTTVWDENTGKSATTNRTEEFKDKQGQVVLKRSYIGATAFSTYYVYSDLGLLCCVIPPKATADDGSITSTELDQLCYQYKYDERNRLIEKKLPGAGWEYLIYDNRDRLVLTQDTKLRSVNANQYHYTLYDGFNRPVEQGISTDGTAYVTLRETIRNSSNYTPGTREVQIYTWYDNYDFRAGWGGPAYMNTFVSVYPAHSVTDKVKGLVAGSKTKVLESSPEKWIYAENHYDKYGRLLQRFQENPEGGYNRESFAYDFEGKITDKQTFHKKTAAATGITLYESYTYDHMGRQLTSRFGYNTTTLTTLATNTYDELGRLSSKQQHNGLQYNDYAYNIREWLTKVNDPGTSSTNAHLFALQLFYDTDMTTSLNGGAQYNGNINGMKWRLYNNGTNQYKGYNFTYDGLNRVTKGDYGTVSGTTWSNPAGYDLNSVSYDANGNIIALNRKSSSGTDKDNFAFTLNGNQLGSVTGTLSSSYGYDGNGNLTNDNPRGLTVSYYNELDLPKQYYKDANNKVVYQYDATGTKWSKTATTGGSSSTTLYYGSFIYQDTTLVKVLTPEGYYDPATSLYHYYLKDHLGNTRITYHYSGSTPVVDQEVEYYPFGMLFTDNNLDKNKYLYNGKELNKEFFENYDYGARFYDAQLGRWHTVDEKTEKHYDLSPYVYTANNPIKFIDPDGKDFVLLIAKNGAGGYGHMGAVVQDGNGKYYYMTVGNADATAGTSKLLSSGTQGGMVLQPLDAKNMGEAVSLAKQDKNNSTYTDQLQFSTSSSMDKEIYGSAKELQKNINSGETKYNALVNNCADAVVKVVEEGAGVNLPAGASPKPNDKFASIKEDASSVQYNIDLKTGKAELVTIRSTMDNTPDRTILIKKPDEIKIE
jgi:RHS repeat-associated protein